jgi:hypothetical protein
MECGNESAVSIEAEKASGSGVVSAGADRESGEVDPWARLHLSQGRVYSAFVSAFVMDVTCPSESI